MNLTSTRPYSVVSNTVPTPHSTTWISASRHGARNVLTWSSRVGGLSSIAQRSAPTIRVVTQKMPTSSASAMYAGPTTHVSNHGASVKMLGTGNATVTSNSAT